MPAMECPNENITFWLYTRSNKDNPHQIMANVPESIKKAPWVKDSQVKVLIHGYTGYKDFSPNTEIRPAYLECCDYNIISVDYNPITREPCYYESARNTELVGKCLAHLIDVLVESYQFKLSLFHIIGFSLGGHVAGFVSNFLKSGKLERITALDPALPLFVTTDVTRKIDANDAKFVDVLHTNALEKGKLETCGHVDHFANGGMNQPGCKATEQQTYSGCNHARAPVYYAESITSNIGFYGTKCYSWITYLIGWCELVGSSTEVIFGEHVPRNASGIYFFSTNSKSPYARGKNKKSRT
ncbi:pancreatic lipase-related protein 3-like [Epargyreus clarus]|uniref:pancreatic lipase-related protein 3-like n=1 Tax=Epargyreus clarus TaxID=520877 RepID=UPI003C2D2CFC